VRWSVLRLSEQAVAKRYEMMRSVKYALMGAALGLVSQAAMAFQETTGKSAPQATEPAAKIDVGKGLDLSVPSAKGGRPSGPEIRIPGLGTIGALPKLDFGLELLYGAAEPKGQPAPDKTDGGDLQIRGTMKYKLN
jgi:hypothetical protein